MLVLSRQRDQAIMIGDDTEISIVDIRGDKVRIGINAPRSVSVHRKEIYEAIRKENLAAAQIRPEDISAVVSSPQNPPMKIVSDDPAQGDPFLRVAIDEAKKSLAHGGIPIGAVLVRDGRIIGKGHNRRLQRGDPMAQAEIDCLTNAARQKTYTDTMLYTTQMPCFLCAGAIVQFGIPRVVVGDAAPPPSSLCGAGSALEILQKCNVEITLLNDPECAELMAKFKQEKPEIWREEIGEGRS